jgi:hypothetical protein
MKITAIESLKLAKIGSWELAWELAQQDEGLNEGVTFDMWKVWAEKAIG